MSADNLHVRQGCTSVRFSDTFRIYLRLICVIVGGTFSAAVEPQISSVVLYLQLDRKVTIDSVQQLHCNVACECGRSLQDLFTLSPIGDHFRKLSVSPFPFSNQRPQYRILCSIYYSIDRTCMPLKLVVN